MGTISPNFHNLNGNSNPQDYSSFHDLNDNSHSQSYLGFHDLNENPLQQNYSTEMQTPHLRPRSNSAPRVTMPSSTSFSSLSNTSIRQSQQREEVKNCKCGLEPVLREVKVNTPNKGRWFWSCSKFGGPDHSEKCNYFKWENSLIQNADVTGESSSTARDTQDTYRNDDVVVNNDNKNNINTIGDEVNTSPINNNDVIENPSRSHNRASSQALSNTSNGTTTNRSSTNRTTTIPVSETGDAYTRSPAMFNNWENVPKYTTPQLMDIVQNHLAQQDKNYKEWYTNTQLAKKDYEEAKKEVEKLMRELEIVSRENELFKRENEVLKAEKRLMERQINVLNEENRDLKRRR